MTLYRVDDAQVRAVATGELLTTLVGQPVQIVARDTTSPVEILDDTESPIPDSMLTVTGVYTVPRFWIDVADPAELYLDWYDPASGVFGPVEFEAVLRDAALRARDAAEAAEVAAAASAAAAEQAAAPITGRLAVADTATLNLTMTGEGVLENPYEITGAVVGAAPETLTLGGLSDVDTTGASSGDALVFDGATWEAVEPAPAVADLDDLSDVNTTGAADGDSLVYDGAGWVAEPARNPVTVSATAPVDPELHDIWFDIS